MDPVDEFTANGGNDDNGEDVPRSPYVVGPSTELNRPDGVESRERDRDLSRLELRSFLRDRDPWRALCSANVVSGAL